MVSVSLETPEQAEVRILLHESDAFSASLYPPESCHLVDTGALAAPEARFLVARAEGRVVGCGALILGAGGKAEIKRMFVSPASRGDGIGRAILEAIENSARDQGVTLLQLETGTASKEALEFYRRSGYTERGPFGTYRPDAFSVFMEKAIQRTCEHR
jgi:putative acetyltransferase